MTATRRSVAHAWLPPATCLPSAVCTVMVHWQHQHVPTRNRKLNYQHLKEKKKYEPYFLSMDRENINSVNWKAQTPKEINYVKMFCFHKVNWDGLNYFRACTWIPSVFLCIYVKQKREYALIMILQNQNLITSKWYNFFTVSKIRIILRYIKLMSHEFTSPHRAYSK